MQAKSDAVKAVDTLCSWTKPYYTLAQVYMQLGQYTSAVEACTQGRVLLDSKYNVHDDFSQLLDKIVVLAAQNEDLSPFFGRKLEVWSCTDRSCTMHMPPWRPPAQT